MRSLLSRISVHYTGASGDHERVKRTDTDDGIFEKGSLPTPINLHPWFPIKMSWDWSLLPAALVPFLILIIRIVNLSLSTLRVFTVVRGRKRAAWILGFAQSLLFITVIAGVLINLDNPWNLVAYAAGFATGNVLGIIIDDRIAPGHSLVRITSPGRGAAIAETLHQANLGATEVAGSGREGTVSLIYCYSPRRQVRKIKDLVLRQDSNAFMTVLQVRQIGGGWHV